MTGDRPVSRLPALPMANPATAMVTGGNRATRETSSANPRSRPTPEPAYSRLTPELPAAKVSRPRNTSATSSTR